MYLTSLANRDNEIQDILDEYNQLHKDPFPAEDLDEVIENIDEI
jgi:hypothetical protein